jgi:transcriptional regulator with XRE-family HTH domain
VKKKRRHPVSANIKRLRLALDLTQEELGKRVREHKSVISHWERGRYAPTTVKLPLVADALGVTIDALLSKQAA